MCDVTNDQPLWELDFLPTAEEYYEALCAGGVRKAGKMRLIVQTAILAAVALWSVLPVCFGGTADYMLAGVAVAVALCMWLVPPLKLKSDARHAAAAQIRIAVRVFADCLQFGSSEPFLFDTLSGYVSERGLILSLDDERILLPFRAMPPACRAFLLDKYKEKQQDE